MGCYSDDLFFVHVPKCAGWSCKHYMREHVPGMLFPDDKESGLPIGHVPMRDVEKFTGRPLDSFKKIIAIIREPHDQQLSQWLFWRDRRARQGVHVHDYMAATHQTVESFLLDERCDFHLWYETHPLLGLAERPEGSVIRDARRGIYWYWLSVDDELPDNLEILKFEEIGETFPAAVAPFAGGAVHPLGRENATPTRRPWREYYTPLAAQLVELKFAWAFDNYYERLCRKE